VAVSCEHGNELLSCRKAGNFVTTLVRVSQEEL
jgi:hypothetical protein